MSTDCLLFDDRGRPTGLNWEAISPTEPEVLTQNLKPVKKAKKRKAGKCGKGHDLSEFGRKRKNDGGTYCLACKNLRSAEYRKQGKQKEYRKRKREEEQAKAS